MEADKIEELFDGQLYLFIYDFVFNHFIMYYIFVGKLKAADAYMSGKLKISGSLMKAMKLEKLMKLLKAKY